MSVDAPHSTPAARPEPPAPRRWRRRTWPEYWRGLERRLTVGWVLYTLSIGPLFWTWFESRYVDGPKWIAALYLPMQLARDYFPAYRVCVDTWIYLWTLWRPQDLWAMLGLG